MASFVLVHGAWHGSWCWDSTVAALTVMGHRVEAPTLTGLAERSHLMSADITPDTHVADVVNLITWRDLSDVYLVGHSYGGMVITGVAGQIPDRLRGLIYLDAFVPEVSGLSLFATANPERMARFQAQMDAGAVGIMPDLFDAWAEDRATRDWLRTMCSPQPKGTFLQGATLTGRQHEVAHRYYILCEANQPSAFWAEYARVKDLPGWRTDRLPNKHDAMVENPEGLVALLDGFARETS